MIFDNLEVTNIAEQHDDVPESAFLVKADDVVIFHTGDYVGAFDSFKDDLKFLADKYGRVDIAFLFLAGETTAQSAKIMKPNIAFPMHGFRLDYLYRNFPEKIKKVSLSTKTLYPEFEGDVFFHVQADATYEDWESLKVQAEEDFKKYNWGVYAPNVDFTEWNSNRANIVYPSLPNNRSVVACPDCTCWMIHKDIINEFNDLNLDMSDQNLGFGIDMLICSISHRKSRPVIRNYNHTVDHPRGTGYDVNKAHVELKSFWSKLPQTHKETINLIYGNPQQLGLFYVESG